MTLQEVTYVTHESSYFNDTVHGKMRRIALNSNGDVVGIHDKDNTNLWEDGTNVDWTSYENNGWNCMVQIPKFYYKVEFGTLGSFTDVYRVSVSETQENGYKIHPTFNRANRISDFQYFSAFEGWVDGEGKLRSLPNKTVTTKKTRANFRVSAELNGASYRQQEFYLTSAIQMLFITEFTDMNSQRALGLGRTTNTTSYLTTGQSLSNGNHSYGDKTDNSKHMSYRGIENFWGNYWKFLDGLNVQNYIPYVSKMNFADNVFTGDYVRLGTTQTVPANASTAYIKNFHKIEGDYDFTFIPSTVGASSSTYIGDGLWTSTGNKIAFFGGSSHIGLSCGAFHLYLATDASYTYEGLGSRLSYLPN